MKPSTQPKFKVLVAHFAGGSDPSRGPAGNPVPIRTGFILQQVTLENGTGRVGGPIQHQPTVDATHYQAAIQVLSNTYWDPTVAPPGPFYTKEEVQVFDRYFVAGDDFGIGMGSGAGAVNDIATSLAASINTVDGVSAVAILDTVYISSDRFSQDMAVSASNDTAVLLAGYVFDVLGASGVVLTSPPQDRRPFYLIKTVKCQSAPVILP